MSIITIIVVSALPLPQENDVESSGQSFPRSAC